MIYQLKQTINMMTLSEQVGNKLWGQCQKHFDMSTGLDHQGVLLIERINNSSGNVIKQKGFLVHHSGQFKFEICKNKEDKYEFNGEFEGFYKTSPRTAQKITSFPTPATIEYSLEMSQ